MKYFVNKIKSEKHYAMVGKNIFCNLKIFTKFRTKVILLLLLCMLIVYYILSPQQLTIKEYSQTSLKKSPPIVVEILGGLGNQLFQYAAAFSIAKNRNSDIYICVNGFDVKLKTFIPSYYSSEQRKYSLDQFHIPQDKLLYLYPSASFDWGEFDEVQCGIDYYLNGRKIENVIIKEENVLNGELPEDKVLLVKQLFESEIFFASHKQDILNTFQPKFDTKPIAHLIQLISLTENSVSVHIRRGDMAKKDDFRLLSITYQQEAMQFIKRKLKTNNVNFFVFTDDLDYVKKHLDEPNGEHINNIIYMSEYTKDNTLYDFILMMTCQHNIIANSTYSWWAAYLNKNLKKIVVAPMPKYKSEWIDEHFKSNHSKRMLGELAYPKEWYTIKPTFLNYSDVRIVDTRFHRYSEWLRTFVKCWVVFRRYVDPTNNYYKKILQN